MCSPEAFGLIKEYATRRQAQGEENPLGAFGPLLAKYTNKNPDRGQALLGAAPAGAQGSRAPTGTRSLLGG